MVLGRAAAVKLARRCLATRGAMMSQSSAGPTHTERTAHSTRNEVASRRRDELAMGTKFGRKIPN